MYNALEIARYIIDLCNESRNLITNLKLQKILYFVQAEFLVALKTPCFYDEIYAWNYGPVVPTVYRKYKFYGGSCIPTVFQLNKEKYGIERRDREMIDGIVNECNKYSAAALVEITHNQAPWKNAYGQGDGRISCESILAYFAEKG